MRALVDYEDMLHQTRLLMQTGTSGPRAVKKMAAAGLLGVERENI